jgi:hypothetical protein
VNGGCVDGDGFLRRDVGSVLEVTILSFLLGFEVETSKTTKILSNDGLVDCCSPSDTFSLADVSFANDHEVEIDLR